MIPVAGKHDLVLERARRVAAIMTRAGAAVRVLKVVMGADAGNIEIFGSYQDFSAGMNAFTAMGKDPDALALRQEHEKAPAGELHGPYVYRSVFGERSAQPVLVQRLYQVPRQNLADAIGLLPEARAAFDAKTGMVAVIPVFAPEMDRLNITYYADSLETLGQVLDTQAMSEAFQSVVTKASKFGTLLAARVLTVV